MQSEELVAALKTAVKELVIDLQHERRRSILRELEKEFIYGNMLSARLRAERLLHPRESSEFKDQNFAGMYRNRNMATAQYADIAAVCGRTDRGRALGARWRSATGT